VERAWPSEALDFEAAVRGALQRAGGVDLARRCEADPTLRESVVQPLLEGLGVFELDIAGGEVEAAAGALAMTAAGSVVCPWPLVQQLAVPRAMRDELEAVYLRDGRVRRAEHLDVAGRAAAVDLLSGEAYRLRTLAPLSRMPLDPFGVRCEIGPGAIALPHVVDAHVVLASFWTVGALARARDLAAEHARTRRQFGRRIAEFGAVQWHLSDIATAHDGLWELASFSLARMIDGRLAPVDTLALYFTMLEAASDVLSHAHQVLAALGLCDEHDLTVLNRHLQPILRRPCGMARVLSLLGEEVARSGFDNLYPIPAAGAGNGRATRANRAQPALEGL
jgi:acyl-CoA dehydrogenase-like protein